MRPSLPTTALLALALSAPAFPQEGGAAWPTFRVEDRAGGERELVLGPEGAARVELGSGGDDVRVVRDRPGAARERPVESRTARLELGGGDPLRGEVRGGHGERLFLELFGEAVLEVPIDDLRSLRFPARLEDDAGPLEPAPEGDRLYRRAGAGVDRIDGLVGEFTAEGVVFESVLGLRTFPWEEVAALFVEELEGGGERSVADPVVVDLVDGSRVRGGLAGLGAEGLRLARPGGVELELPLTAVSEVVRDDGTVAYLSDLEPSRAVEGSPFDDDLGMVWPHRRDLSVTGRPLRAGGRVHSRGLGVHAPSRLEYELGGAWRTLRGRVAIDDEVVRLPARGSVVFRVLGDGEVLWESGVLRGGDAPVPLPELDLGGVGTLTLEADMADDLHLGDRADWLGMLLVR